MRIISREHDYYDPIQKMGQDQSLIYVRETEDIGECNGYRHHFRLTGRGGFIGFCGKAYPFIQCSYSMGRGYNKYTKYCGDIVYNFDDIDFDTISKHSHFSYKKTIEIEMRDIRRFFTEKRHEFGSLLDKHPVMVQYQGVITKDVLLREYDFQKVSDPYTAFQEIAMFIGNIPEERKTIPQCSDEDLAQAKGFDKWSFRKEPNKKP